MTGTQGGWTRWLAIGAAAVLAVGGCGGDDDGERSGGEPQEQEERSEEVTWDERIAPIAEWVAEERELDFDHAVEVRLLPEDEYQEQAAGDGSEDEEDAQEAEDTADLLRALGLLSGDVDLEAAGADLAGEGTLAYYDSEDEVVYVRGEELTPSTRVTLAHELTHVLQDQHFDLDRLDPDDEADAEDAAGLRSLAEGDADRIGQAYARTELTLAEREDFEARSEEDQAAADEGLAEVPPALVALTSAPYALGGGYVTVLDGETGAIDAALEDPPSEQVLFDPAVEGTDRAEEVEVEAPQAPEGAEVVDEDTFGPVSWFLLLAARGAPAEALQVVDGWGGDAFVSYRQDDRLCVDLTVAGDDADATAAFGEALQAWAAQSPGGSATVETAEDAVRLHACDPGEGAEAVGEVPPDVIALPLVRTSLEEDLQGSYSASPEEARCASTAVITELSLDQLTAEELPPEVLDRVQAITDGCRA